MKDEPQEDYLGAALVAVFAGLLMWWALRDPEGIIYAVVFTVAQLHF